MPDPGPFGDTFFEASDRAIVSASFVNKPRGGKVETVLTFATHLRFGFRLAADLERLLADCGAGALTVRRFWLVLRFLRTIRVDADFLRTGFLAAMSPPLRFRCGS